VGLTFASSHIPLSSFLGGAALLEHLRADQSLMANKSAQEGVADMGILFTLLGAYKVMDRVSLAPGYLSHLFTDFLDIVRSLPCTRTGLLHWHNLRSDRRGISSSRLQVR
jgi:hypothetical protein